MVQWKILIETTDWALIPFIVRKIRPILQLLMGLLAGRQNTGGFQNS